MRMSAIVAGWALCAAAFGQVAVGRRLPEVQVADQGLLVPHVKVVGARMVMEGKVVGRTPWALSQQQGRVRTLYHLAGRMGIDDVNKPYIDALLAANLDEFLPDSPYKTVTIIDASDALFGTSGLVKSRTESSQKEHPHALFVVDAQGVCRKAWGLEPKQSTVIVLDRDNTVLFFRSGKLTASDVARAVSAVQEALARR